MYDKCYFCLDQLPKLKKRIHSKLFRKFWRNRGTKEPAYITVLPPPPPYFPLPSQDNCPGPRSRPPQDERGPAQPDGPPSRRST